MSLPETVAQTVAPISPPSERLNRLSPERRALLALRLQKKTEPALSKDVIRPHQGIGPVPAAYAQQRLWLIDQLQPGLAIYNMPMPVRISGMLDVQALEWSLNEIVARHDVLRTSFEMVDSELTQVVAPFRGFTLECVNLSGLPEAERESEARRLTVEDVETPFDLSTGPMFRVRLLRLGEREHLLLLTIHHIICDGWSTQILWKEISTFYQTFAWGLTSPLAELPIQYVDYAAWQREWLAGGTLAQQLNYWKEQLAGAPATLGLPTDWPRPAVLSFSGAEATFTLSAHTSEALRTLGQQEGVTLFMTLLTAFNVLLYRYSGQDDIVVGTPVAGRNRKELEGLVGFFANTLALRTRLNGDPTFIELLRCVQKVTVDAYTHEALPFERLVEELQPERDLSRNPLFQVMFTMQNATAAPAAAMSGLTLGEQKFDYRSARFDLELNVWEEEERLAGNLFYSTELFEADTIRRILGNFEVLLDAIATDPKLRISELPLLTETEQRTLVEWNDTLADYDDAGKCLHALFEAQVERDADAVALTFEEQQLTYAELNARANRLAHYLRMCGVGPDVLVGICADRSVEMVVGLFGILKAGGAYVPFDPQYPEERLQFMLEDAHARVLLTQAHLLERLPETGAKVVCLDADWAAIAGQPTDNPSPLTTEDNLAYVIYTSGSTGKPKGAMNTHAGIVNRLLWMQEAYHLTEHDVVLQKTPFSFDVSVWEFFWPLLVGARLVVARPGGHQDRDYLVDLINRSKVTTLHFVPSMLQVFLDAAGVQSCVSLRQVICSGEALPFELQERFFARQGARLHNLYGPTEAAVDVSYWECQQESERRVVPIGKPITNLQLHVLDRWMRPVPVGVAGELHIGGIGLARGYHWRPELTAEKFIPDPFSHEPGGRLYRTGDLARYLPDGNIEFLGRLDFQVKIRGLRIELGEIETVLRGHPDVNDAVVVATEKEPGQTQLVAYVVAAEGGPLEVATLRSHLNEQVPEYMVPAFFVMLDALPLSPNGKIDRKALPDPEMDSLRREHAVVGPSDVVELKLVQVWEEILGVAPISVKDNFFELGGHSLLGVYLMARIEQVMGGKLPLAVLFKRPTIRQLAELLREGAPAAPSSPLVELQPDGVLPPFFAVHGAGGSTFSFMDLARQIGPERPFYGLQAMGLDDRRFVNLSIEEMATRYVEAIRAVAPEGPYYLGGVSAGGAIAFEMARQLKAVGEQVARLVFFDSYAPDPIENAWEENNLALISNFAIDLNLAVDEMDYSIEMLKPMSPDEQLAYLLRNAQAAGIFPAHFDLERVQLLLDVLKANVRAKRRYRPQPLDCPVTLFRAMEEDALDEFRGWSPYVTGELELILTPGNHYTMLHEPNASVLAERLSNSLSDG
jgi:amino acid adenylation domain-containing protein